MRRDTPLRIFLSHALELRGHPRERSYADAAMAAVMRAGHAISNMAYFAARDTEPADYCTAEVQRADVFVGIIGLRYGSPVRDRPEVSYTELEFEAATAAGIPRLILLVRDDAAGLPAVDQPAGHGGRQEAFRRRLQEAGVTTVWVSAPAETELRLYQALVELKPTADVVPIPPTAPLAGPRLSIVHDADRRPESGSSSASDAKARIWTRRDRRVTTQSSRGTRSGTDSRASVGDVIWLTRHSRSTADPLTLGSGQRWGSDSRASDAAGSESGLVRRPAAPRWLQVVAERTARPLEGSTCNRSDRRRRAFADDTARAPCPSLLARRPAAHLPASLLRGRDRPGPVLGLFPGPPARRGAAGPTRPPAA
jgi:Domain of unknown function (DUF4062)